MSVLCLDLAKHHFHPCFLRVFKINEDLFLNNFIGYQTRTFNSDSVIGRFYAHPAKLQFFLLLVKPDLNITNFVEVTLLFIQGQLIVNLGN